jgi:hypothetical protein
VAIVAEGFENDAMSAAASRGMPGLRFVSEKVPGECTDIATIEAEITADVMGKIISALTRPLTAQEKSPNQEVERLPRIVYQGSLQEVNHFFYRRGWTDGLPIMPPTEAAVQEMLTGTDLPPEHIVAELEPRLGKATVEKIAVNAVMAGALPTYLPLLIAGVEALADPGPGFRFYGPSTGSWAPFWIVNGPVRQDVHVYGGGGALSPGHIANATIGRAMGLIIKNIAGLRQGIEDMGVQGNPCKYGMVVGENEEESPWEPLHVERGFDKQESTISLFFPNSYVQVLAYSPDTKGVLNAAVYNIPPGRGGITCLLVNPTYARYIADEGWTKKDMETFIRQYARAPRDRHWASVMTRLPKELTPFSDNAMPLIVGDDQVAIVVSGKYSSYLGIAMGYFMPETTFATRKVKLPQNWKHLVAKYRDLVPTYVRY